MFTKKTKRYLMLLAALGLIAIAAGSSGTFASFNAEVSNNNNTFTSGTLFLHNIHGSTECASESGAGNSNITAPNGCATLFTVTLPDYSTTIGSTLSTGSPTVSLPVAGVPQTVKAGDELVVTQGGNSQRFFVTANSSPNDSTIAVESSTPNFAYTTAATVVDDASVAKLQLKNTGSLAATDIKFALGSTGCVSAASNTTSDTITGSYTGGETTLNLGTLLTTGVPSGTTISIAGPNAETVTTSAPANPGDGSLTVSALANAHSTGTSISWAISFGAQNLCTLPLSVIETDSSYHHVEDSGSHALGCAFGPSSVVTGYGCDYDASHRITDVSTYPSLTQLTLASGGSGNTGTQLDAGGSRYFLIAVQSPTGALNSYQNKTATFDLVWHIDQ